jgi:hypothetical protein
MKNAAHLIHESRRTAVCKDGVPNDQGVEEGKFPAKKNSQPPGKRTVIFYSCTNLFYLCQGTSVRYLIKEFSTKKSNY